MGSPAPPASHRHRTTGRDDEKRYDRRRPEEGVLYSVVQVELETFLARAHARERPVPRFVERELRSFLRCGILAHGFVRVHCDDCGLDRVVAFSCKGRGFCPSCGGRRMGDTTAHLVDRVLPQVPVRQWVLSLPFALRYRLAYDATLLAFTLAQLGGRGQAVLTAGAALEAARALGWRWLLYDYRAWRRGRRAAWLVALPWEELLPLRLDTVRRLAGVAESREAHPRGLLRGSVDGVPRVRARADR